MNTFKWVISEPSWIEPVWCLETRRESISKFFWYARYWQLIISLRDWVKTISLALLFWSRVQLPGIFSLSPKHYSSTFLSQTSEYFLQAEENNLRMVSNTYLEKKITTRWSSAYNTKTASHQIFPYETILKISFRIWAVISKTTYT